MSDQKLAQTLKDTYIALKRSEERRKALECQLAEPIAVVGMACRFPGGATTPRRFWTLLAQGVDAIDDPPAGRWPVDAFLDPDPNAIGKAYTLKGGYLREPIDGFDHAFFKIAPKEAPHVDPQQRLLLETSWEALEDAGLPPSSLFGAPAGVFVGICNNDYSQASWRSGDTRKIDTYSLTGSAFSVAAGRLSYFYGFEGPSFPVDTACSSALIALHLACQSLRARECNLALAAGVNLILTPEAHIGFCRLGVLAPDGRCKTFDAAANGYARSEGCGTVALKRLSDAVADDDRIWAVVRGTAVNQDGRSNGLTAPNGLAQERAIRAALRQAGADPADIDCIEAHGTGTMLGDPVEVEALGRVFAPDRPADRPLYLGSVKTNIGHLEAAAGMAGLIKVILSLNEGAIPRHLHFQNPNPRVDWAALPFRTPLETTPWPAGKRPRMAGLSAFGFGGSNAHAVIGEAPAAAARDERARRAPAIFTLSARTPAALTELARRAGASLSLEREPLADLTFTAQRGRDHFECRLAAPIADRQALRAALTAFADGAPAKGLHSGSAEKQPKIALRFPAHSASSPKMTAWLDGEPAARRALERCAEMLKDEAAHPSMAWLAHCESSSPRLKRLAHFVTAYALAELWRDWGVRPALLVAAGPGEWAAATFAGALNLEDGLALAAADPVERVGQAATMDVATPRIPLLVSSCGMLTSAEDMAAWLPRAARLDDVEENADLDLKGAVDLAIRLGPANADDADVASLETGGGRGALDRCLGALYAAGVDLNWRRISPDGSGRKASLPFYPFQRRRCWTSPLILPDEAGVASEITAETLARQWVHADLPSSDAGRPGPLLLLIDDAASADRLTAAFEAEGLACFASTDEDDDERAFDEWLAASRGLALDGVDPMAALAVGFAAQPNESASLWPVQAVAIRRLLRLTRRLDASKLPARLALITREAVAAANGDAVSGFAQAGLWGMGRTIALERPAWRPALLDVGHWDGAAEALARELACGADGEAALRRNGRYEPRLSPFAPADRLESDLQLDPDGWCLIAGGFGTLGLAAARWLAGHGARKIALLGRRALPPRTAWDRVEDERAAALIAAVRELETLGLDIRCIQADICIPAQVGVAVHELNAAGGLTAVVHAAGAMPQARLEALTPEAMREALAAKAEGAWNLHRALAEADARPALFLLFSSIASAWGAPRLTGYAAANASLDALAERRRALTLPALSLQLGPFADSGIVTRAGGTAELERAGVQPLSLADAPRLLDQSLGQTGVALTAAIDWPRFLSAMSGAVHRRLFADLSPLPPTSPEPQGGEALQRLAAAPVGEREALLAEHLAATLRDIGEFPPDQPLPPEEGFFDLGIDSLMAVAVKERLERDFGLKLRDTLLFDFPNLNTLCRELLTLLEDAPAEAGPAATEDDMSLEDIKKLLEASLS